MGASRLTRRERAVVTALADAIAAPAEPLPAVQRTDTVEAFERWLAASPRVNRVGLRIVLRVLDHAPLLFGRRHRLPELPRPARTRVLRRVEHTRLGRDLMHAICGVILITYYGDDGVMRLLGYDADANVERGRRLIAQEGRPA